MNADRQDACPTIIGMVTFGNLAFTQLAITEIKRTTHAAIKLFVVVGQPEDAATAGWLDRQGIDYNWHHDGNRGFAASINDIYDYAWGEGGEIKIKITSKIKNGLNPNLILCGNDVVPYPGCVDALIEQANTTHFEWIAASQFDVRSLLQHYPEQGRFFTGDNFRFEDFSQRPWAIHEPVVAACAPGVETNSGTGVPPVFGNETGKMPVPLPSLIKDVRNLCLFKRSVFDQLGYADVNFWPGGYFEDNDYARRAVNARIKSCALTHAQYFHFWSRTIHQGSGTNQPQFQRNGEFYRYKWGAEFGAEKWAVPFNGVPAELALSRNLPSGAITLPAALRIGSRAEESRIIEYWRGC